MGALDRVRHGSRLGWVALTYVLSGCTTTLDPISGAGGAATSGCGQQSVGGSTFATCVDLPACIRRDEAGGYLICEHPLSYEAASHECELRGGHLVEIDSEAENALLVEIAGQTVGTNVWLGGQRTEAYIWAWQHSQVVFWHGEQDGAPEENIFVKWQPGEPNNSSTVTDEPEKCLALTLGQADWNDRACSLDLPFVCEAH